MEIGNIVKGHVNEMLGFNKDIKQIRLDICHKCPIFSNKFGGLCNNKLWLDPETNDVSFEKKDGYYRGCGCRLQAKTTIPQAVCPAGKW